LKDLSFILNTFSLVSDQNSEILDFFLTGVGWLAISWKRKKTKQNKTKLRKLLKKYYYS